MLTKKEVAAVFSEWKHRYDQNPEAFNEEWQSLNDVNYGIQASEYFLKLLEELFVYALDLDAYVPRGVHEADV